MHTITDTIVFAEPMRVCVEATTEVILSQNLDTWAGEHFDFIDDVIAVHFDRARGEVTLTTCRTLARPMGRETLTIPTSAVAELLALRPSITE